MLDAEHQSGTWDYLHGLSERPRHMVALGYIIGLDGPRRVLDIGCGTGSFLELAQHFSLSEYHGIDLSQAAILRARRRFRAGDAQFPVRFEVADFETFSSETLYDAIVFEELIPYAQDPLAVVKRFEKFLSPQGVFLVSLCYNWWQHSQMDRITDHYRTIHSAEVINEQGLTWEIRLLEGHPSGETLPLVERRGMRQGWGRPSGLTERWVMFWEIMRAILRAAYGIIGLRRGRRPRPEETYATVKQSDQPRAPEQLRIGGDDDGTR